MSHVSTVLWNLSHRIQRNSVGILDQPSNEICFLLFSNEDISLEFRVLITILYFFIGYGFRGVNNEEDISNARVLLYLVELKKIAVVGLAHSTWGIV